MKVKYETIQDKNYNKNEDMTPSNWYPCVICGKGCKEEKFVNADGSTKKGTHWLHLVCGAEFITDEIGDFGEPNGDMGWFPVGNTCWKKWMELKKQVELNTQAKEK